MSSSASTSRQSGPRPLATRSSANVDRDGSGRHEERAARRDLALAFRLAERFGFHEGICNHFSLRLAEAMDGRPGHRERYLINPYGLHWSMIEPDSLLVIDGDGRVLEGEGEVEDTARFIHVAAHRAVPRHRAVLHTHMPWATTLTMLEGEAGELQMAHQSACRFHGRVAYEPEFAGLAHDDAEGSRLARGAASRHGIDIVFLASHGVMVGAPSVALAFDELYYLERVCRQQVLALQSGAPLKRLSPAVVERTAAQTRRDLEMVAEKHFRALGAVLARAPDRVMTF